MRDALYFGTCQDRLPGAILSQDSRKRPKRPPTPWSSGNPGGYRQHAAWQLWPVSGRLGSRPPQSLAAREGEALPFRLTRDHRIRLRCAEIGGWRPLAHGSNRNDPGLLAPLGASYPGHTAGPVLQHRPSETLPRLWNEQEGLAM